MNDHEDTSELPEVSDDAIRLLYRICELATETTFPPFKALFAAYDSVLQEQDLEQEHDAVLFRYLMRVGESTRAVNQQGRQVNLVQRLRSVLEAQGITLLDAGDDGTQTFDIASPENIPNKKRDQRRVSFNDARIDERWLSEHSESITAHDLEIPRRSLSRPARKLRGNYSGRRVRSTSSDIAQKSNKRHPQHPAHDLSDEGDRNISATLLFDLSHTQLEQNADAFLATSELRSARRAIHKWHDETARVRLAHDGATLRAEAHDRKTLLKQAWEQWRATLQEAFLERQRREELSRQEKRAVTERNKMLMRKALELWSTKSKRLRRNNIIAKEYILMIRYFTRWKLIAVDNQIKMRSILCRKALSAWREKTAKALVRSEQGIAHYEERLLKRYRMNWFWKLCENRVKPRHDEWTLKQALSSLVSAAYQQRQRQTEADKLYLPRLTAQALRALEEGVQLRQDWKSMAGRYRRHVLLSKCLLVLRNQARLGPIANEVTRSSDEGRRRKAFEVWRLHASLIAQAAAVSQHRVLQNAWTNWNDALRCKALAQKIDERVLLEATYKWVLLERSRLFDRTMKNRLAARVLATWRLRAGEAVDRLQLAERVFVEGQHTRKLSIAVRQLNMAMRERQEAGRAAVEFAVSRECPKYFKILRGRYDHACRLAKWAMDARFYFVCSSTLRVWKARAEEHKQNRKREAYAHIRASVKFRLASRCFGRWHAKTNEVQTIGDEAVRLAGVRVERLAVQALGYWRERADHVLNMEAHAISTDREKLLSSALGAFVLQVAQRTQVANQASDFRLDTELAILEATFKRMQWARFTAARREESAEALYTRNRSIHIRNMLRHWASRTKSRRAPLDQNRVNSAVEAESPSIRPASRAASRSAEMRLPSSPPSIQPGTPGYMRTPSHVHRRAGRFRSLPTPAPVTPMAFDAAYLVTTPGPLETLGDATVVDGSVSAKNPMKAAAEGLTLQVTPFARKLRAGGFTPSGNPTSALRSSIFGKTAIGTNKSVRFGTATRFGATRSNDQSDDTQLSSSQR